jgi:hypothetical protein
VARRGPTRGKAEVFVNGTKVATVDLSASSYQNQRVVWSMSWSSVATRTVTIRVVGTSGRPWVDLDCHRELRKVGYANGGFHLAARKTSLRKCAQPRPEWPRRIAPTIRLILSSAPRHTLYTYDTRGNLATIVDPAATRPPTGTTAGARRD